MLVTLPVYSKEKEDEEKEKSELHLWLTDNTHIVDIGPVSEKGEDDVTASSLLYESAEGEDGNQEDKLIALYEKKKKGDGESTHGIWSVRLTEQLQRVKDVMATWKRVDGIVSKLCPTSSALEGTSTGNACSTVDITDGLVGFLSGNFSDDTWRDEYLGVSATVKDGVGTTVAADAAVATGTVDGVTFKGRGAGARWPVCAQGRISCTTLRTTTSLLWQRCPLTR
ncbi:trans-sialidase, putative, partial [Trypanosoma cruzi marinkellei]